MFLLVVEFVSIREKADKKTKKELSDAADLLSKLLNNDNFKDVLRTAIEQSNNTRSEKSENPSE